MSQIKDISWNIQDYKNLFEKVTEYKMHKLIPLGFSENEFVELKKQSRTFLKSKFSLDFENQLIIASGHQPEFQHPGILFKDLMANFLAKNWNGLCLHIIVDTDASEFSFLSPAKNLKSAYFNELKISSPKIYKFFELSNQDKNNLIDILNKSLQELECFVSKENLDYTKNTIEYLITNIKNNVPLNILNTELRRIFFEEKNLEIFQIHTSELINLKAFKKLVLVIKENFIRFRNAYNHSLQEYRKIHKIKNHAQPLPDLHEDELPFWVLNETSFERISLKLNDSLEDKIILPKAVTLTMFMRLFLSDFFIHGKGGGRYEEVSEKIFEEFFQIKASPYAVGSATLNLEPSNCFQITELDEKSIEQKLRDAQYSPEKFLSSSNPLVIEKKELQTKFSNPEVDKKELHKKIMELNLKMTEQIKDKLNELENLKNELPSLLKTKEVFESRIFPFYFYNMQELITKINLDFKL